MRIVILLICCASIIGCSKNKKQPTPEPTPESECDISSLDNESNNEQTNFDFVSKQDGDLVCYVGHTRLKSDKGETIQFRNNLMITNVRGKKTTFVNPVCYFEIE